MPAVEHIMYQQLAVTYIGTMYNVYTGTMHYTWSPRNHVNNLIRKQRYIVMANEMIH